MRWNDFEQNISNALREVREEGEFFDCTLSTGEKQVGGRVKVFYNFILLLIVLANSCQHTS